MASKADFKIKVEKLSRVEDWQKWKWQVTLAIKASGLETIVLGTKPRPDETKVDEVNNWNMEDAKAMSLLASTLNSPFSELVFTCSTSNGMWQKLCARFERSSLQRLDSLIEQFFKFERDETEDMATHIAKRQNAFTDLNVEYKKQEKAELSERILMGRVLSTLGDSYNSFKDVWENIQPTDRTMNLLIERLCNIERRDSKTNQAAFSAEKKDISRKAPKKASVNKKMKYPCNICKQLGHWARECTSKSETKPKTGMFAVAFSAADEFDPSERWICDSGASVHITPNRGCFSELTMFEAPRRIYLGKKGSHMDALGQGTVTLQICCRGEWHEAELLNVWYSPDASGNLFSVQAAACRGFDTVLTNEGVEVRSRVGGQPVCDGNVSNGLYILSMRARSHPGTQANLTTRCDQLQLYHERLGHQNKRYVKDFLHNVGIQLTNTENSFCDGCALGKMHQMPFRSRPPQANSVGELIHADVNGPMSVPSLNGSRYFLCLKDDFTKFRRIFFLVRKSEVFDCLKVFLNEARANGHTVRRFRSDGGGEFCNAQVAGLLSQHGIERLVCPPYSPQTNGSVERENRTIVESARSMLSATKLTKRLWQESCETATYLLNLSGRSSVKGKSPTELWTGRKVKSISHLKIFGTECYVYVQRQFREKFEDKGRHGYIVGYVNSTDGYRVWVPSRQQVISTLHVQFKDEVLCNRGLESASFRMRTTSTEGPAANVPSPQLDEEDFESADEFESAGGSSTSVSGDETIVVEESQCENESRAQATEQRRSSRKGRPPQWIASGDFALISNVPASYEEAMKSDEKQQWTQAIEAEITSIQENKTWDLVERPVGAKVLKNRWVLRLKDNGDRKIYKACLVAKGFAQTPGVDFDETFSPVARYDSVRLMLAIAASRKMSIHQFDVKTAFLYGSLSEEVFIEQPVGLEDGSGRVCKLNRGLYGLRQAPRCWNKRFGQFMTKAGFRQSSADPCLFYKHHAGSSTFLTLYVDDGLLVCDSERESQAFLRLLEGEFKITTGDLTSYLGINIEQYGEGGIRISQARYVEKILQQFNMRDCNPVSTPIGKEEYESDEPVTENVPYRAAVGVLLYVCTATRPDISYAVNRAARSMEKPTKADWIRVQRIFKYLKGTADHGILYGTDGALKIYTDADFAGDTTSRKSTSGMVSIKTFIHSSRVTSNT